MHNIIEMAFAKSLVKKFVKSDKDVPPTTTKFENELVLIWRSSSLVVEARVENQNEYFAVVEDTEKDTIETYSGDPFSVDSLVKWIKPKLDLINDSASKVPNWQAKFAV